MPGHRAQARCTGGQPEEDRGRGPGRPAASRTPTGLTGASLVLALLVGLFAAPVGAADKTPRVAQLEIEGCDALSARALKGLMQSRPRFWRKPEYRPRTLASDLEAILGAYESQGYLDARIASREVELVDGGGKARIRVTVEEGPRTRIGSLRIEGASRVSRDEVHGLLRATQGQPFRQRQLLSDRARVQRLYAERGMIDTYIGYRAVVDSPTVASVSYDIHEGPPVRVGEIVFEGLDKTRPHIVRRELKLWPGDLYRHSALERSQTAVFSTGLFRSVLVEPAPAAEGDATRRDLRVAVRERRTGAVDAGVGYGTSERLRAALSVSQTNWLGRALRLGASTRASRLMRRGEVAFTNPRLLSQPYTLDWRAYYEWERNPEAQFRTQRVGTEPVLSYTLDNGWVGEAVYQFETVELFQEDIYLEEPARTTSLVGVGTRRDSRDNPLDARYGHLIRGRVEYAGGFLGGDNSFRRITTDVSFFHPWGRTVLAAHVQASHIAARDTAEVVEYERFYLGGDRSVRGYARGAIGAERIGHVAFSSQLEARLPLGKHVWALFADSGQVWEKVGVAGISDLEHGYGTGLRLNTRFGLLRLDLALSDRDESLRDRLFFYFGVGQSF